jgi:glycosyltransferase involved in cell wall biosynthesis
MISAFYPPDAFGGDAIFIQNLNRELLRRGHEVDVIHCADSYNSLKGRREAKFAMLEGVTTHALRSGAGVLAPLAAHQTGRPLLHSGAIRRVLRSKPFDVVHFHNISVFGPKVLHTPAPANSIKLYTAHEHWLVCPLSVLWKNGRELCLSPSCFACSIRAGRPPQLWRHSDLLAQSANQVDAFLALSQASAEAHRQRGFRPAMRVLPGFAALPAAVADPSPHARPYFLFVGRLEKYKGVQDVIPLFDSGSAYDLLIAGAGGFENELRRFADGRPQVHLVGWKSAHELGRYYKHARALIAPSLTLETFGMVVAEAMAHGAPVIARDLGPYRELLAGGGGLLFRDRIELAGAVNRLGADDELRAKLSSQAVSSFLAERTPEIHVDRYLSMIAEIRRAKSQSR